MKSASFYELFCAQHRCQPAKFNDAVLRRCFCRKRYYPARLLALVRRGHFDEDFALIEAVKQLTSADAVEAEIICLRDVYPPNGLLRGLLNLRLSAKRVACEAGRLFARADGIRAQEPSQTSRPGSVGRNDPWAANEVCGTE